MTAAALTVPFGRTGVSVSPLCVGTSSWGPSRSASEIAELADAFFSAELGVNFLDTSNMYGGGESEVFVGDALRRAGSAAASAAVVQTKLDRDAVSDDFGGDRMWRSLEESFARLGVDRVPVLYLHDPEVIGFEAAMRPGGPVEALVEMKARGLAGAIGISGGPVDMLRRFVETDLFDALVTHNRFTLVDRSASALLDAAAERSLGITNAAPYGGGVLTGRARFAGSYGYRPIRPAVEAAVDAVGTLCSDAGVSPAAAALQFSLRDPRIHSTIVGVASLSAFERTVAESQVRIPDDLWAAFDAVVPSAGEALDR